MSATLAVAGPPPVPARSTGLSLHTFLTRMIWVCVAPLLLLAAYLAIDDVADTREDSKRDATNLVTTWLV